MLSTPSTRGLKLPIELVENEQYVCFENTDDLADKTRHCLAHEEERAAIARAGRERFELDYDLKKHGRYIAAALGG